MQQHFRPAHLPRSSETAGGWLFWLMLVTVFGVIAPGLSPDALAFHSLIALSVLGMWRYGWAATHLVRALMYCHCVWPRLRQQAAACADTAPLVVIVTAYQMPDAVLSASFCALIGAAEAYPAPVTIVAAVGDAAEQDRLTALYHQLGAPAHVRVLLMLQDGCGKRAALAEALRQARALPQAGQGLVALMDGDTIVRPLTLRSLAGIFASQPRLGALTAHNASWSDGGPAIRAWHSLRMAQRHIMMMSQSLSRRVLVLTGRFSVFRGCIALDPAFAARIRDDRLDHWRYGAVPFLTGDDKSTWFHVLCGGWEMRYVPDVSVDCIEPAVARHFVPHSLPLMQRWLGNMLRNAGRGQALGPRRMPWFTWWSLVDQGVSMWTALLAPAGALLLACAHDVRWLWMYAVWVLVTRMGYAVLIAAVAETRLSPWWPFLLFYNQIVGSFLKIHMLFRLPRQRWTRQQLGAVAPIRGADAVSARQYQIARVFEVTAWLVFAWLSLMLAGLAPLPFTSS